MLAEIETPPVMEGDWERHGLCIEDENPRAWFPEGRSKEAERAKLVCLRCPVRSQCLELALSRELPGIWGGTSQRERQQLRRDLGRLRR